MQNNIRRLALKLGYVRSVDEVEKATGMDFFYQLDDNTESQIERK